jgi:phosphomevalonate kinase
LASSSRLAISVPFDRSVSLKVVASSDFTSWQHRLSIQSLGFRVEFASRSHPLAIRSLGFFLKIFASWAHILCIFSLLG